MPLTAGRAAGRGMSVSRLHRDGESPLRVLIVAEAGPTTVPRGGGGSHFGDEVVDRLWLRMRRGLEVDVLQEPWAALHAIRSSFPSRGLPQYDLIVVIVDPPDLLTLRERRGLMDVLETVLMRLASTTDVVLIELESARDGARHRGRTWLAPALLEAVRSPSVRLSSVRASAELAGSADAVARHLEGVVDPPARSTVRADGRRTGAPADGPGAAIGSRLTQIAHLARSSFAVDSAVLDLVLGAQLVTVAVDGTEHGEQPRAGSLCGLALGHQGLVVIGDTWADPSLHDYRAVRAPEPVRFYAGYPIAAPGRPGAGALCIYDRDPHPPGDFDFSLLRDLAMLAEGELVEAGLR